MQDRTPVLDEMKVSDEMSLSQIGVACPQLTSSCGGRRMADTAAHLVDRVLPEAPVRQWVLSLPFSLRYRLAYDARLTRDVLRIFIRRVFASLRRRARDRPAARAARDRPGRGSRRDRSRRS